MSTNRNWPQKIETGVFNKNLSQRDIIPIVNYGCDHSFAEVCTNLKAIRYYGWGPLSQILLKMELEK